MHAFVLLEAIFHLPLLLRHALCFDCAVPLDLLFVIRQTILLQIIHKLIRLLFVELLAGLRFFVSRTEVEAPTFSFLRNLLAHLLIVPEHPMHRVVVLLIHRLFVVHILRHRILRPALMVT